MRYHAVALFILLCVMAGSPAAAADPDRIGEPLRKGVFLYSAPHLRDPNFAQSVVLLVTYGEEGASGLIINRSTHIAPDRALPNLEGIKKMSTPVHFGGPVNPHLMLILLRSPESLPGAQNVLEDLYFTTDSKILSNALRNQDPDRTIRIYAGYSGWAPGQLDREFARGDWISADADPSSVFSEDPSRLWSTFFENRGKIQIRFPEPEGDYTVSPGMVEQ